jgi:hypothetical protein
MISFVQAATSGGMKPGKANLAAAAEFQVNVKTIQRAMALDRWYRHQQEEHEEDARLEMQDEWNEQNEHMGRDDN